MKTTGKTINLINNKQFVTQSKVCGKHSKWLNYCNW